MALGNDRDAKDTISKLLQMGTVAEYENEAFSLARATEARFTNLQILEFLRTNLLTLGEAFFRARITEARFKDNNSQAVDTIVDEEGKNVEDQQDSKGDDDTNNDDVGYMRQPIEDESWFLAHEIDYPNVNEKKADHVNNKSTQENRVLKGRDVSDEKSHEVFSVTP
uniref:Protein kinase, catalytic domain-containing protein n=1 Tax=Tanacetum cinerariifolium TaxID=118510 RepID=A0A6L2MXW3_TANCI|nr:protein kinase, catalytic domain-containing protein [Tanacetum cinerariifolium]